MQEPNNQPMSPRKIHQSLPQTPAPQKHEHPPSNYSLSELYMIRKQSIFHSNQLISRRISRCFQRIKRLKQAEKQKQIYGEYDQETSGIRKAWRKLHDLYKGGSRVNDITHRKIEKMKNRIQKVKRQVNFDEEILVRDVDLTKAYIRNSNAQHHQPASQKNLPK